MDKDGEYVIKWSTKGVVNNFTLENDKNIFLLMQKGANFEEHYGTLNENFTEIKWNELDIWIKKKDVIYFSVN